MKPTQTRRQTHIHLHLQSTTHSQPDRFDYNTSHAMYGIQRKGRGGMREKGIKAHGRGKTA